MADSKETVFQTPWKPYTDDLTETVAVCTRPEQVHTRQNSGIEEGKWAIMFNP